MTSNALKRSVQYFLGTGPCHVKPFARIAATRVCEFSLPIHRPEYHAGVVAAVPPDSVFSTESFSLLGQQAEPELVAGTRRYRSAGLLASLPRELWLLDDAAVAGAEGAVWCPRTRTLVAETAHHWFHGASEHPLLAAPRFPDPSPLTGLTLHLGALNAEGYFHFLHESLPKLALARPWLPHVSHILANGQPGGFQEKWLRLAGVDPKRILWLNGLSHFRCEQLLFTRSFALDLCPSPWIVAQLRDLFPTVAACGSRRLWITRRATGRRHLAWEEQLLAMLPDFECVDLAALEPAAQIALMASSSVVAGPIGAGFSNIVFCSPGARVIIIRPSLQQYPLYDRLATAAGLAHSWLAADFLQPVDISRISAAITEWIGRSGR
ncbi:MAG: glycosyltransferase family 61 protein [Verrucomicrobia bacterium]|nr:glycosyltransferase family 61 protein [Verrucomicrobiota bacterium]